MSILLWINQLPSVSQQLQVHEETANEVLVSRLLDLISARLTSIHIVKDVEIVEARKVCYVIQMLQELRLVHRGTLWHLRHRLSNKYSAKAMLLTGKVHHLTLIVTSFTAHFCLILCDC